MKIATVRLSTIWRIKFFILFLFLLYGFSLPWGMENIYTTIIDVVMCLIGIYILYGVLFGTLYIPIKVLDYFREIT